MLTLVMLATSSVSASDFFLTRESVRQYISTISQEHQLDPIRLANLFAAVKPQQSVLDAISRPAERTLTWAEYRAIFIQPERIKAGKQFMLDYADDLARAEGIYGVPANIIAAIIGVETYYGRIKGKHGVLAALATLAFDYPPRSKFFKQELTQFLILSQVENWDATAIKGSYAGAMGWPQFIASSYREYAIDFDGDDKRDLLNSVPDAIGSVAHYLHRHKWQKGRPIAAPISISKEQQPAFDALLRKSLKPAISPKTLTQFGFDVGDDKPVSVMRLKGKQGNERWVGYNNFYVITRYNHSRLYAMAVLQLSRLLADA